MQTTGHHNPHVLIITGPTASGKTALSELIVKNIPGEIINADIGQFYTPLSVGTAKPNLSSVFYRFHGFDIINDPCDLSVVAYRSLVIDFVNQVLQRNKLPIVVGGSLFYLKSLFFPPHDITEAKNGTARPLVTGQPLWQQLQEIDPVRAEQLHPHDEYRIKRALSIWQRTGVKPSLYKPSFLPPFKAVVVFINPHRDVLKAAIKKRVNLMMQQGWVEEVERLVGTPWEEFLQKKGLIGYPELIGWVKQGKKINTLDDVIKTIQNQTINYAKRQITFGRSFMRQLHEDEIISSGWCSYLEIADIHEYSHHFKNFS